MTQLLVKIFIKDYKQTDNSRVRSAYGNLSGVVGIVLNLLLAVAKVICGVLFGLISLTADGINNFSDCGSNVVSLISFRLSGKPADKDHPYGHQRIEYVASMIVSFIILLLAYEIGSQAILKIIDGTPQTFEIAAIVVLAVSVLVKLWMFVFNRRIGNTVDSELLKATAMDSLSDAVASFVVLVSLFVSKWTGLSLDGYLGIVVALFIAFVGLKIFRSTFSQLIGEAPTKEMLRSVKERITSFDGVLGIHDLFIHSYGPHSFYATVHVEVDSKVDVLVSHDLTDRIEKDFAENTNISLVVHLDPVDVHDEEVLRYKALATQYVHELSGEYSLHDFRVVKGITHTNWIFDVAIPYEEKRAPKEIREILEKRIHDTEGDVEFFAVITVENQLID